MKDEVDSNTNYNWCTWKDLPRLGTGTGKAGNWRMIWDHPNYYIRFKETCCHSHFGESERSSTNASVKTP